MKFLKGLLAILGLVGLIGGGVYLGWTAIDVSNLVAVANANKSQGYPSPMNRIYITVGLAALGALLLGLGIGMPNRTAGGIRKEALQSAAAKRETEIRTRAADGATTTQV